MSIFENAADLLHELKVAAGTVLTILGSKLEADARARVECGPQWLTEFEEQRDSLEPDEQLFECSAPTCGCHDDPRYQAFPAPEDSAVAAADPSPTVPNAHSVVGDCPGSDSVILPTVEPGPSNLVNTFHCQDCGVLNLFSVPPVVAGESPREDEQPSLGEPAEAEDADELAYPFCC
ncbi:hypothetical protein, partial [Mycolicibacterium fortuitum]|uniref:hypothetical protein n=1 Tax=Mycolicibacterium fortuitum TaxID=1766 RepID=UPI00148F95FC|nr:hypothetical protein [Mycolicibacterium fortuitum]